MFIDSHAHLEMREFDRDRDQVVNRALGAGLDLIITVGTNLEDCFNAVEITKRYPCVYAILGIHPHEVKDISPSIYEPLKKLAASEKVVGYGEIGLDFFRNLSPRDVQIKRFEEQLELAHELNLPIVIHDRDAHKETMDRLKKWPGKRRGIVHCFSGDARMAQECVDMGFYISITGAVTFKKSERLLDVVGKTPLERILIETDAPYLTPEPHRGERNEPAYVVFTAHKIAEIKGVPTEEVGRITSENARTIFGIKE
jgi:TatD DNase family protein